MDLLSQRSVTHGEARSGRRSAEYVSWQSMLTRCFNPRARAYPDYGARGITVCPEWAASFEAFLSDMGRKPSPAHSVDRVDNDAGYHKLNCRWSTRVEQARNRRGGVFLTHNGITMCVAAWATETGISGNAIYRRVQRGWPAERALTPVVAK